MSSHHSFANPADILPLRRSLSAQIRLLIPAERSEQSQKIIKLIRSYFPPISGRIFLLGIPESKDPASHLSMRQDLQELTKEIPSDFQVDIIIRSGEVIPVIMKTAYQNKIDLIVLAYKPDFTLNIYNTKTPVVSILRKIHAPIMLIPETIDPVHQDSEHLFRSSLALLNVNEQTRLSTAYALRTVRLLSEKTLLIAKGDTPRETKEYLSFVSERYWPPESINNCETLSFPNSTLQALKDSLRQYDPNLLVVSMQDRSYIDRYRITGALKNAQLEKSRPLLVVNRPDWISRQEKKLIRIYQNLSEFDLAYSPTEKNHVERSGDITSRKPVLFMGCYSKEGLKEVFRQYGLFKYLKQKGYPDAQIDIDELERGRERLRVFPEKTLDGEPLVDLILRHEYAPEFDTSLNTFPKKLGPFLHVEWLCLQDPLRSYKDLETPLPGQKYPGLGISWKVMIIIKLLARRLSAAGLYNIPEYYHTARLYHRFFRYSNPDTEARLLAIDRDTFPIHVVDVSWAFLHGLVLHDNQQVNWSGGTQILPLDKKLTAYFASPEYSARVRAVMNHERFYMKLHRLRDMMMNRRLYKEPGA